MESEIYQKYGLYNPMSYAVKLMRALEFHQNSEEFRMRFKQNLKFEKFNGDISKLAQVLQKTLNQSKVPKQTRTVNFLVGDEDFGNALNFPVKSFRLAKSWELFAGIGAS